MMSRDDEIIEVRQVEDFGASSTLEWLKFYAWAVLSFLLFFTVIFAPLSVWIWNKKAYPAYSGGYTAREMKWIKRTGHLPTRH